MTLQYEKDITVLWYTSGIMAFLHDSFHALVGIGVSSSICLDSILYNRARHASTCKTHIKMFVSIKYSKLPITI